MVVLHALGQCLIRTAVTTITPRADMCFAMASYLTRERGRRIPRRVLEAIFWPGMRSADASHSLSELLHKLGRKGVPIQRDGAACVWLPRDAVGVDVESLSIEPPSVLAERDLSILPGYAPRASPAFSDWVDDWRGHMQLRVLEDVVNAISRSISGRDWKTTLALADQALKIDHANEPALLARARAAEQLALLTRAPDVRAERNPSDAITGAQLRERAAAISWPTRRSVSATGGDTTLVGREQLMQRLRSQATRTRNGEVCSTFISAPTGIGKSRIVRELTNSMYGDGAAVCAVSCGRHDGHRPLSVFIQAVPHLQALPGAAGCAPTTIACLARITQLATYEAEMTAQDDSLQLPASICAAVIDLVDAVADEQPLLLVVEDVHWIDPASWALLRTIAATAQRSMLVLCTSRVRWQQSAWGEPDTFVIEELSPLDASAARAHISNYLARRQRSTDDRFIDWCVETSGGNPYFVEELVNFWIATGEQFSTPPSLIVLVEARLACLRPEALRVIQAAAILGKNSTVGLLQHVLEFPTHVLFSAIEELGESDLLTVTTPAEESRAAPVLCRHALVSRAAMRRLSVQGRALLHHAAARAIEWGASGSHSAELLWDCADHWQAAGQSDRSIAAEVACARHLHEMGLVHEAAKRCESALARCSSNSSRLTVLRSMVESRCATRDWRVFCEMIAQTHALKGASDVLAPVRDDVEPSTKAHRADW